MAGNGEVQSRHAICAVDTMLVIEKVNFELKTLKRIAKEIQDSKMHAEVGFFKEAKYSDGKSVAFIAYLNEFGDHNPPRPFMKRTTEQRRNEWTKLFGSRIKANGLSKQGIHDAFGAVGLQAVGDMKKVIKEWSPTDPRPNKPATIRAKARRARSGKGLIPINPETVLIDSGVMISSIQSRVKDE